MKGYLYVTDLDGTLLTPGGVLSKYALRMLQELQGEGAAITVASGRNLTSIKQALGDLEIHLPLISSDGALISTYKSSSPLFAFSMERPGVDELLETLLSQGYSPLLDILDGDRNFTAVKDLANHAMVVFKGQKTAEPDAEFTHVADLRSLLKHQILSITLMETKEKILRALAMVKNHPEFKVDWMEYPGLPGYNLLWIQNRRARKEEALDKLMELTGYTKDKVIVFGDELNDLGMFQSGCHCVAVSNAREEIRSAARQIIGSHEDEAVAHYIRDHFRTEI